jgi:hypothetical protein
VSSSFFIKEVDRRVLSEDGTVDPEDVDLPLLGRDELLDTVDEDDKQLASKSQQSAYASTVHPGVLLLSTKTKGQSSRAAVILFF